MAQVEELCKDLRMWMRRQPAPVQEAVARVVDGLRSLDDAPDSPSLRAAVAADVAELKRLSRTMQ